MDMGGILEWNAHFFYDTFNHYVVVWLQKWKDDLMMMNHFSLVFNKLELLMLSKMDEVS